MNLAALLLTFKKLLCTVKTILTAARDGARYSLYSYLFCILGLVKVKQDKI
jgi:hypothetical protein